MIQKYRKNISKRIHKLFLNTDRLLQDWNAPREVHVLQDWNAPREVHVTDSTGQLNRDKKKIYKSQFLQTAGRAWNLENFAVQSPYSCALAEQISAEHRETSWLDSITQLQFGEDPTTVMYTPAMDGHRQDTTPEESTDQRADRRFCRSFLHNFVDMTQPSQGISQLYTKVVDHRLLGVQLATALLVLDQNHYFQGNKTRCVQKIDNNVRVANRKRNKAHLVKSFRAYFNVKLLVFYIKRGNQQLLTQTAILVSHSKLLKTYLEEGKRVISLQRSFYVKV